MLYDIKIDTRKNDHGHWSYLPNLRRRKIQPLPHKKNCIKQQIHLHFNLQITWPSDSECNNNWDTLDNHSTEMAKIFMTILINSINCLWHFECLKVEPNPNIRQRPLFPMLQDDQNVFEAETETETETKTSPYLLQLLFLLFL